MLYFYKCSSVGGLERNKRYKKDKRGKEDPCIRVQKTRTPSSNVSYLFEHDDGEIVCCLECLYVGGPESLLAASQTRLVADLCLVQQVVVGEDDAQSVLIM